MPLSDFNLEKINTKELTSNVEATIQCGGNLMAIARRGSGKTTIARDAIKKLGYKEVYFNLSLMERPDLAGYPDFFNGNKDKFINFLMPSIYKDLMEGDKPCVALLDEVDKAETALLAPLLEFVQFRSVNGSKLKNLHAILMTGNLPEEGGVRPPLPLLDRCEKFLVEVNPKHWLDWAAAKGTLHPSVVGYITEHLEDLSGLGDDGENYSSSSPRGWENASNLVWQAEKFKWSPALTQQKVAACVGKLAGIKYSAFYEHYQVLIPVVNKILKGEIPKDIHQYNHQQTFITCMIVCNRFALMLEEIKANSDKKSSFELTPEAAKISKNITKFLSTMDPEIVLLCVRGQIGMDRFREFSLMDDANWDQILDQLLNGVENEV